MRAAKALCTITLAGLACLGGGDANARRRSETSILLRARSTAGLEALETGGLSNHPTHAVRRPVSDLMVRLKPWRDGTLAVALDPPSGERLPRDQQLFAAELIVVAAGRMQIEERATCGPWAGDTALCRTECDGGAFALVRRKPGPAQEFSLRVGKVGAISDAGFGEIVRLGACSDEVVAGGLAARADTASVEVQLQPQ